MQRLLPLLLVLFSLSAQAYSDDRNVDGSKAKSQLRSLHKMLDEIDKTLEDKSKSKFRNNDWFADKYKSIERKMTSVEKKDSGWDLGKEKKHIEQQKVEIAAAVQAYQLAKVKKAEPDPADHMVEVFAGAPKMSVAAPTWCDAAEFKQDRTHTKDTYSNNFIYEPRVRDLTEMATHPCRAPGYDRRQVWTQQWKQVIANATGADEALVAEYFSVLLKNKASDRKLEKDNCKAVEKKFKAKRRTRRGEATATSAYNKAMITALGCKQNPVLEQTSVPRLGWWIDQGPQPPSELLRAMLILSKLDFNRSEPRGDDEPDYGERLDRNLGSFAFVSHDVGALDKAKFEEELKALDLNAYGQVMARLFFSKAQHYGNFFAAEYAKSAELKPLAIDAPKAGFETWMKAFNANKETFEKTWKVEDMYNEGKRTGFGCHAEMQEAFRKYSSAMAKTKKEEADKLAVMTDPVANTFLKSSMICASYDGDYSVASTLYGLVSKASVWRGPRTAAHFAIFEAYTALKAKQPGTTIKDSWLVLGGPEEQKLAYAAYSNTFNKTDGEVKEARVKSAKASKKGLKLTFKTETIKKPVYSCKETNKIDRITSDGKIEYRRDCIIKKYDKVKVKVAPVFIPKQFASKIKKGNLVRVKVMKVDGERIGIPLQVYKTKKRKKLIGSYGVDL